MKIFSENIKTLFDEYCMEESHNLNENLPSTTAIFLASIKLLKSVIGSGVQDSNFVYCSKLLTTINRVMKNHNIDNKIHHFLDAATKDVADSNINSRDLSIEWNPNDKSCEAYEVIGKCADNFKATNKTQDLADLLYACFDDVQHLYSLYKFFDYISQEQAKWNKANPNNQVVVCVVPDVYADMLQAINNFLMPENDALQKLEEIPWLTNVNKYVLKHPVTAIGVDDYIKTIEMTLLSKNKKSSILVGLAGTGKSTIIYELAQRINKKSLHADLNKYKIFELNISALTAGSGIMGSMETKLIQTFQLINSAQNILLFIDEIHMVNSGTQASMNLASMIKPYLTKGEIVIIGATTEAEYNKHIMTDKAFARRFRKILVQEPTKKETINILKNIKPEYDTFFSKEFKEELIPKIVELADNYSISLANPDKSIEFFELAYAKAKLANGESKSVTVDDLIEAIALQYHIKVIPQKAKKLKEELSNRIFGQEEAVNEIAREIVGIDKKLSNPLKPKLTMFFSGPTGCGKTETAKIISEIYSGSDRGLIKVNCGEYSDNYSYRRIIGSDPGFVGYGEESDLIKNIKLKPESVVLFDEIEKAHPEFVKVLLNIMDEGTLKTGDGQEISFRNAIIIFTSNIGFSDQTRVSSLFPEEDMKTASVRNMLKAKFLPEFVGRINKIVTFKTLTNDIIESIIDKELDIINKRSEHNLEFTKEEREEIIKNADIKQFGARNIQDLVRNKYLDKLIEMEGE